MRTLLLAILLPLLVLLSLADRVSVVSAFDTDCWGEWSWVETKAKCWGIFALSCPAGSQLVSLHSGNDVTGAINLMKNKGGVHQVRTGGMLTDNQGSWMWQDGSAKDYFPQGFPSPGIGPNCISLEPDGTGGADWVGACSYYLLCSKNLPTTTAAPTTATMTTTTTTPAPTPVPTTTSAVTPVPSTVAPSFPPSEHPKPGERQVITQYRFSQKTIDFIDPVVNSKDEWRSVVLYADSRDREAFHEPKKSMVPLVGTCNGNICKVTPTPGMYWLGSDVYLNMQLRQEEDVVVYAGVAHVKVLPFEVDASSLTRIGATAEEDGSADQEKTMWFAADEINGDMKYIFYSISLKDQPTDSDVSLYESSRMDFFLGNAKDCDQDSSYSVISAVDWREKPTTANGDDANLDDEKKRKIVTYRLAVSTGAVNSALTAFSPNNGGAALCAIDSGDGPAAKPYFLVNVKQSPQFATLIINGPVLPQQTAVFALSSLKGLTPAKVASSLELRVYDESTALKPRHCNQVDAEGKSFTKGAVKTSTSGVILQFTPEKSQSKVLLCLRDKKTGSMLHFHEHHSHYGTNGRAVTHEPVLIPVAEASASQQQDGGQQNNVKKNGGIISLVNGAEGHLLLSYLIPEEFKPLLRSDGNRVRFVDCDPKATTAEARCPLAKRASSQVAEIIHSQLYFKKSRPFRVTNSSYDVMAKCVCADWRGELKDLQVTLMVANPAKYDFPNPAVNDGQGLTFTEATSGTPFSSEEGLKPKITIGATDAGLLIRGPAPASSVTALSFGLISEKEARAAEELNEAPCDAVARLDRWKYADQVQSPQDRLWLLSLATSSSSTVPEPGKYIMCVAPETTDNVVQFHVVYAEVPITIAPTEVSTASSPTSAKSPSSSSTAVEVQPLNCKFASGVEGESYLKLPCTSSAVLLQCDNLQLKDAAWWATVPVTTAAKVTRGDEELPCDIGFPESRANCMWKESRIAIDALSGIVIFQTRSSAVQSACANYTLAPTQIDFRFTLGVSTTTQYSLPLSFHSAMTGARSPNPWVWSTTSPLASIPTGVNTYYALSGIAMSLSEDADNCEKTYNTAFYFNQDTKLPNLFTTTTTDSANNKKTLYLCLYVPLTGKFSRVAQRDASTNDQSRANRVAVIMGDKNSKETVSVECGSFSNPGHLSASNLGCTAFNTEYIQVTQRCLGACSVLALATSAVCYSNSIAWIGESSQVASGGTGGGGELSIPSNEVLTENIRMRMTQNQKSVTFYWCTKTGGSSSSWQPVLGNQLVSRSITIRSIDIMELDSLHHLSLKLNSPVPPPAADGSHQKNLPLIVTDFQGKIATAGIFLRPPSSSITRVESCLENNRLGSLGLDINGAVSDSWRPGDHYPTIALTTMSTRPSSIQLSEIGYTNFDQRKEGPIETELCVSATSPFSLASDDDDAKSQLFVPASVSIKLSHYGTPLDGGVFLLVFYALRSTATGAGKNITFPKEEAVRSLSASLMNFMKAQPTIAAQMSTAAAGGGDPASSIAVRAVGQRTFRIYIPSSLVGGRQLSVTATHRCFHGIKNGGITLERLGSEQNQWLPVRVQGRYLGNQSAVAEMPSVDLLSATPVPGSTTNAPTQKPLAGSDGVHGYRAIYALILLVVIPLAVGIGLYARKRSKDTEPTFEPEEGKEGSPSAGTEMAETPAISPSPQPRRPGIESAAELLKTPNHQKQDQAPGVAGVASHAPLPPQSANDTGENPLYDDPESPNNNIPASRSETQEKVASGTASTENKNQEGSSGEEFKMVADGVEEERRELSGSQSRRAHPPPASDEKDPLAGSDSDDAK